MTRGLFYRLLLAFLSIFAGITVAMAQTPSPAQRGIAIYGKPKLPADFTHFPYVNPKAPKGGKIVIGYPGSFDSLNPLILRGVPPTSLSVVYDSLMTASADELGVAYPLVAQSVGIAEDRSWAVFNLNPAARFHDNSPITADDVLFTWDALNKYGNPFTRAFLEKVTAVEALTPLRVKITLSSRDEMKPIIDFATTMAPRPKKWWASHDRDISKTTLEPPLGSGPYRVASADSGRSIVYARVADYWGRDLPVNLGQYNFDEIRFDYYRDDEVMFEALKSGAVDLRFEYRAQRWATAYDFPAIKDGRVKREALPTSLPLGAQGFRLNLRRPLFQDVRVREALCLLFDFPWIHKNILSGQYLRTKSNFPNSEYGASGLPSEAEKAVLTPFVDRLDPRIFNEIYEPSGDSGDGRTNLRNALRLLKSAGWELKDGILTENSTGKPFVFEFVDDSPAMTRIVEPYIASLKRAGIKASTRVIDSAQMRRRQDDFDFDVTTVNLSFYPPPGTELLSYFGSAAADIPGSGNYSGLKDPVVDALLMKILAARDESAVKTAMHALDRVLLWQFTFVPHWYNPATWAAWWDRFGRPPELPPYDMAFRATWIPATWWQQL